MALPARWRSTSAPSAAADAAHLAGHAQCHRRRRQFAAHPGGDGGLSRQESQAGLQDHFRQAPAPELPGKIKAQQDAGRVDIDLVLTGTDALSAGIDQKLWIPIATDYAAELPKLEDIYLPGALKMQGLAQNQAVCVVFCPAGPIIEYMPDAVKTAAEDRAGAARLGEGAPEPLHLCAPGQFRPRPHLPAGPALHPGRQGPEGPEGRLGQDLGLSDRARQVHRVLPDRHRRRDEGAGRRLARHDRLASRLGPQPAHPRRGAEGSRGRHAGGLPLGHRRAVLGIPKGVSNDKLAVLLDMTKYMLTQAGAGDDLRQGLFLSRPGGEGRAAVDGAGGQPEADRGIHPARLRQGDRRGSVGGAAAGGQAGLCVPALGPAGRLARK